MFILSMLCREKHTEENNRNTKITTRKKQQWSNDFTEGLVFEL